MQAIWKMITGAFASITSIFSFIEKKEESDRGEATDEIKADRRFDRWKLKEPKQILEFHSEESYRKELNEDEDLYYGTRDEVRELISTDPGEVINDKPVMRKNKQSTYLMTFVLTHPKATHFIIRIHPLTNHSKKIKGNRDRKKD